MVTITHWVPLSTTSVNTSSRLQRKDFFLRQEQFQFIPMFKKLICTNYNEHILTARKRSCGKVGVMKVGAERSQNTVLLASTQAVYKPPHSTVRAHRVISSSRSRTSNSSSSSKKSQSVRLEHSTVEPVAASCTYASAINASKYIQCIRCVQT